MIRAILLAAGSATRFGSNKLLWPLPDGMPIAARAARNLLDALPDPIAVVRLQDEPLAALLGELGVDIVRCAAAKAGMSASLACGLRAARGAHGWVVALADMPFIEPSTITAIARRIEQGAPLAAPLYRGRRGHPVGFGAGFRDDLLALSGDRGARSLLAQHRAELELVECGDPGVLQDIDTPADLMAAPRGSGAC